MHRLKKFRVLKGLTQWDVSLRTGIPASKISLIERGYIPLEKLIKKQSKAYLFLLGLKSQATRGMKYEIDKGI